MSQSQQRSVSTKIERRHDTLRSAQLRVGGGEFVKFVWNKAAIGVLVTTLALLLAIAISTATYWALAAWGAVVIGAYAFFTGRALLGGNGTWMRSNLPQPGHRVQLTLNFRGLPALRLTNTSREWHCDVRDPLGAWHRANHVYGGGAMLYCLYPDNFPGAPGMTPGTYTVRWREREPAGAGKWRVLDISRFPGP